MINFRTIILAFIYSIIIGVGIYFGIMPEMRRINLQVDNLKTKNVTLQEVNSKLETLTEMAKSKDEFDSAKNLVASALPDTLEKDKLTLLLERVTNNSGVKLVSLEVGAVTVATTSTTAKTATDKTTKIPSAITAKTISGTIGGETTYDKIKEWFRAIENLDRIISIKSISLTISSENSSIITADVAYDAYGVSDSP